MSSLFPSYDLIVIGLGHAGAECARASARMGLKVLGIDPHRGQVKMSCVPAMGGTAKGTIVREIDALGGFSGIAADKSILQLRMLGRSKGPAMWNPRTRNDRQLFASTWQQELEATTSLDFWQDMVTELLLEQGKVQGVKTKMGLTIHAQAVVLTSGTFLSGTIHIGTKEFGGGRIGERASHGITAQLLAAGFTTGRLKTGTSPRVDGRTLHYARMEEQAGEDTPEGFSYLPLPRPHASEQKPCYITYTNPTVHALLAEGFAHSPMFTGRITGKGPRYCPSIEDKITRFADKEQHQIFVEPEGWHTAEVYVNGFSTSLPEEVQYKALRAIPGFEEAKMFRPGYAIAYDYFPPTQLHPTLETKHIRNLYFAGQVNGTTGYEEAACQGLMAGINAARRAQSKAPVILERSQAYIGTLIDDLVQKGTMDEPYRMFTSRMATRISVRQDNADTRLTPLGVAIGLADPARQARLQHKEQALATLQEQLANCSVSPQVANPFLAAHGSAPIREKQRLLQLIKRPEVTLQEARTLSATIGNLLKPYDEIVLHSANIAVKYAPYLAKEQAHVHKQAHLEHQAIPARFDYQAITALSMEAREKLTALRPKTLGQASRISGVSQADLAVLMIYLEREKHR